MSLCCGLLLNCFIERRCEFHQVPGKGDQMLPPAQSVGTSGMRQVISLVASHILCGLVRYHVLVRIGDQVDSIGAVGVPKEMAFNKCCCLLYIVVSL